MHSLHKSQLISSLFDGSLAELFAYLTVSGSVKPSLTYTWFLPCAWNTIRQKWQCVTWAGGFLESADTLFVPLRTEDLVSPLTHCIYMYLESQYIFTSGMLHTSTAFKRLYYMSHLKPFDCHSTLRQRPYSQWCDFQGKSHGVENRHHSESLRQGVWRRRQFIFQPLILGL